MKNEEREVDVRNEIKRSEIDNCMRTSCKNCKHILECFGKEDKNNAKRIN